MIDFPLFVMRVVALLTAAILVYSGLAFIQHEPFPQNWNGVYKLLWCIATWTVFGKLKSKADYYYIKEPGEEPHSTNDF